MLAVAAASIGLPTWMDDNFEPRIIVPPSIPKPKTPRDAARDDRPVHVSNRRAKKRRGW